MNKGGESDGLVTLSGVVDQRREKRLAQDIAYSIPGVVDLINKISVEPNDGVRPISIGNDYRVQGEGR